MNTRGGDAWHFCGRTKARAESPRCREASQRCLAGEGVWVLPPRWLFLVNSSDQGGTGGCRKKKRTGRRGTNPSGSASAAAGRAPVMLVPSQHAAHFTRGREMPFPGAPHKTHSAVPLTPPAASQPQKRGGLGWGFQPVALWVTTKHTRRLLVPDALEATAASGCQGAVEKGLLWAHRF